MASSNTKTQIKDGGPSFSQQFDVDIDSLKMLMEFRGLEGLQALNAEFNGASGLCEKLHTNPNEGELIHF